MGGGGRGSVSGHTVTVFGASGFLGRYLVNELGKQGCQVVIPYRGSSEDIRHLKVMGDLGQVVNLRVDVRDEQSIRECVRHSDTVYNLIGREWETRNFSFEQVHVDAARLIAKVSKQEGVDRLVHVSALNADPSPEQQSSIYRTKGLGELAVKEEFPEAVIVRPALMYGWEDRLFQYFGNTVTHQIKRWLTLGYIPLVDNGIQTRYPVYVGDVARALEALLHVDKPESLYELVGPNQYTYHQLIEMFCDYARRPFFPVALPYKPMRTLVGITQRNPLAQLTVAKLDMLAQSDHLDANAAGFRQLDIDPEPLGRLIIRFVRHFRHGSDIEEPASLDEVRHSSH
jgi:NADH dehydrogenase (ubiquinone) 1 alpha subcomplex subunit 9